MSVNVAADVKVRVPKEAQVRDRDFTMPEALAILRASLIPPAGNLSAPHARARRWIPWLCAYTGCRVNEMSQLRKEDVREVEGVWIVNITPEAGDVKTGKFRETPLHAHVIEQGFVDMVQSLPEGPVFYDPAKRRAVAGEDNRHVKKVGERLAAWVRKDVGITDPNIKPNHAWRHLFKTLSAEAGIEERVADAIQGHAPATTGRRYGKVNLTTKAAAVKAFPRFAVHAVDPESR
jgi:integrase